MLNPIIWSIDPFQTEIKPSPSAIHEVEMWARRTGSSIQPVYVLAISNEESIQRAGSFWLYSQAAREATQNYISNLGIDDVLTPMILLDHSSSIRHCSERLVEFAEELDAKMILVTSRGRAGFGRLVFGSFGESLVAKSHLPVLFLTHPGSDSPRGRSFNRVLFPTDFSDFSKKSFELFVQQVKTLDTQIILFHEVTLTHPMITGFGGMVGDSWIPEDYFKERAKWAMNEGKHWIQRAHNEGVSTHLIVGESNPNIAMSIMKVAAEQEVGLIAMAAHSTPVEAVLTGSVAQEVFRSNQYPVWVCGPKMFEDNLDAISHNVRPEYYGTLQQLVPGP